MHADYCLYTVGLSARDIVSCALDESDLVITLGFDMVEYHPRLWNPDGDKRIVHADFLPAEIDAHYHPDVELIGDLAHALWMFNERVDRERGSISFDLDRQRSTRYSEAAAHAYDFADVKTIVDVGGGNGGLLTAILTENPLSRRQRHARAAP